MGNCQNESDVDESATTKRNGPVQEIRVTNFTWTKDYQGLFDYESTSIQRKKLKINRNRLIAKTNGQMVTYDQNLQNIPEENQKHCLFKLTKKQHFYQINPVYNEQQHIPASKMLWLVVKSVPGQHYILQQKDIIKLGKQRIRVRQIVHYDQNPSMVADFNNIQVNKMVYEDLSLKHHEQVIENEKKIKGQQGQNIQGVSVATSNEHVCRICLEVGEKNNPLITPCKCSGSVRYIHLTCLRQWLAKRLQCTKYTHYITINWQVLSCEMCKANFKYRIYLDNKKFYTVQIPKPAKPYIVLEVVKKNEKQRGKVFHFVSLAQKSKVSLGRRKDIDVRISEDISVSRFHASIEYNDLTKTFILNDNKSKFGTLVLIRKSLLARPQHSGISFQVGAQVFSFDTIRTAGGPQTLNVTGGYFNEDLQDQQDMQEADQNQSQPQYNQQMDPELAAQLASPQVRRSLQRAITLPIRNPVNDRVIQRQM